jgi:outer membrane immunogenic protein
MKKLALAAAAIFALFTGSASAADMAVKARPVVPPVPVFSWTGFYIGIHGGGAWFDKDWTGVGLIGGGGCGAPCPVAAGGHNGSSWLVGAQAGVNYQTGMFVLGAEVDGSWTELRGSNVSTLNAILTNNSHTDALATFAGRVGIAAGQALFYAKGGAALADDSFFTTFTGTNITAQATDSTRWGWMVGVGIEYAFANNWSVKAEYNHLDFGRETETLQPQPGCGCVAFRYDVNQTVDLVKVGLNYRFGWGGPVVAKY